MLQALELVGFKSFADKTCLAFPPGITVIVGPNGSGKSNIVDAIKWVLGAQSVKSLRGKEMVDVIFNGSGARRPMNTAEVTLTFDNAGRRLAVDTPEVAITRRVYRSGEAEYLINRRVCRLREIRDLFAGTGIATEAYSVIEQGKVDVLLQSSARDRRAIFEEAAGISRFKAKKLDASRRLERVDQNLLRLSDIVDEVESRLRSVRLQASKARRYRDYTSRLRELRTLVGLTDWRALSDELDGLGRRHDDLVDQRDRRVAELELIEAESLALDTKVAHLEDRLRVGEASVAENRERITAAESAMEHQRVRRGEIAEEIGRHRRQLAAMTSRAGSLDQQLHQTRQAAVQARAQHERTEAELAEAEADLAELNQRRERLEESTSGCRAEHMELVRTAARLGNQKSTLASQEAAALTAGKKCQKQLEDLARTSADLARRAAAFRARRDQLAQHLSACQVELAACRDALAERQRRLNRAQKQSARLEGQLNGARERAAVLAELERRLEGLGAGVKQVLVKARQVHDGPYRQVRGLVADLIQVNVETAPLVEMALGETAQYLVVADAPGLPEALERDGKSFSSRVGFLRLEVPPVADPAAEVRLEGHPGVLGRADRFVESSPEFAALVRRLLGTTYFVEKLSHAFALAEGPGRGLAFVTLAGERLAADGSVVVGPRHTATGLLSRRSELRALAQQVERLQTSLAETQSESAELEVEITTREDRLKDIARQHVELTGKLGEHRLRTASADEQLEQLGRQQKALAEEARTVQTQYESAAGTKVETADRLAETEAAVADLEQKIAKDLAALERLRSDYRRQVELATRWQVERARSEQHLDVMDTQLAQFRRDREERQRALDESRSQLQACSGRMQQIERTILRAESLVAELYLSKERLAADTSADRQTRASCQQTRGVLAERAQQVRAAIRELDQQVHEIELEAGQIRQRRDSLAGRMREDYDIELAGIQEQPADDRRQEREEVEREIADLRKKINHIGSVNLEALEELDQLESRFQLLASQHDDLQKAKATLERIITRINSDSRRLFAETLEAVRGHFQALFRKLFGGGQADIVLEDDVDILESGIEIVARPPGKEPRSISLLSGGEKTLTCVALLLAIFRNRPSPFCVLDEVDAALDETNIGRFVGVLNEFLSSTQFVVITHSKKTMTAASTLHGVTMQESGVSKRVSVRFEDVTDDGQIRDSALQADAEPAEEERSDSADGGVQAA